MEMYHVPVGREEKRERWDPMTSLKSDVGPHERTTCHGGEGRQLCCGPGE
jgi:hypothetical protein